MTKKERIILAINSLNETRHRGYNFDQTYIDGEWYTIKELEELLKICIN